MATYKDGVLVGNWYENRCKESASGAGQVASGTGTVEAAVPPESEFMASYTDHSAARGGQADPSLAVVTTRAHQSLPPHLFFGHSGGELPTQPQEMETATINMLTLGEKLSVSDVLNAPHTQALPLSGVVAQRTSRLRRAAAARAHASSPYVSTAQATYTPIDVATVAPVRRSVRTREITANAPAAHLPPPPPPPGPPAWVHTRIRARR